MAKLNLGMDYMHACAKLHCNDTFNTNVNDHVRFLQVMTNQQY